METEYIEKQAALDIVNGWRNQLIPTYGENDEYVKCLEMVAEHLELLHVADVRPVDVGLWLRVGNTGLASCRCGFITDRYSTYRYCPSCGRKNEGVEYGG